ncbi:hypothetical protein [Ruminococcus flavefaciens]|uniref:hypothetical protein n=1 Tax=Ruminococcus flavefaciens TaxID=1265 RepID=UPI00068793AA|nr:hypothetical protein [Ruminococcus flavefaciens]
MKKSVYSLVLMDDVIKAVDQQAYRLGTSRSNLINQILAEHLSCVTPEMRMREIFGQVAELVSSSFCVQEQRSPSLMTVRTALEYKYRPTINYKVELERAPAEYLGTLRVSIRTQSAALIDMFHSFFAYRAKLENAYLSRLGVDSYSCEIGEGSFARKLINTRTLGPEEAGAAIGEYIKDLDRAVKTYFAAPKEFGESAPLLEKNYRSMLEKYII